VKGEILFQTVTLATGLSLSLLCCAKATLKKERGTQEIQYVKESQKSAPKSCLAQPRVEYTSYTYGIASWYGEECEGNYTASGELFEAHLLTAASYDFLMGSYLKVSYKDKSVIVKVNDLGPNKRLGRKIDLSRAAFEKIAPLDLGLINVKIEPIEYENRR